MRHGYDNRPGPIADLRLPARVWTALRRENIRNLEQLKAVAYRIDRFDGIGPTTARFVRQELARTL
jgi:hypothetical protein